MMGQHGWAFRPWYAPESRVVDDAFEVRMHRLSASASETEAVARAVGFPPSILPLVVRRDARSDELHGMLAAAGAPALAIGPAGAVFRLSHRLPMDEAQAGLYEKGRDAMRLEAKAVEEMATHAPMRAVFYMMPDDGGRVVSSFPFTADRRVHIVDAHAAAVAAGSDLRVVVFHDGGLVRDRVCPLA